MNKALLSFLAGKMAAILILCLVLSGCAENKTPCTLPQEFINTGEVPDYSAEVFEARRKKLMGSMQGDMALLSASVFNDFYYLTGFEERRGIAVIDPEGKYPFVLFVMPADPMTTLWDGERQGVRGAMETFGADTAFPLRKFEAMLPGLLKGKKLVSVHSEDRELLTLIKGIITGTGPTGLANDIAPLVHEMRVIKDKWEISQLEKAIEVTCLAHRRAMQTIAEGQKEFEVQAEIEYVFLKNGLRPGFPSITGSGPNAAILHYTGNDRSLVQNDLLLMDIGAACKGYSADVTRTIPVSGKFTPEQKEIYELVLKAQEKAIQTMVPGNRILDCHHRATDIIVEGLFHLGLITDTSSFWQKRFYIHYRNNHYIGLHVHDAGSYGDFNETERETYLLDKNIRGRELLPGMVLTIEPGIYLIADRLDHLHRLFGHLAAEEDMNEFAVKVRPVYEKYAGIGIRIEDDILVTETGNRILSVSAPKTVPEIEQVMRRK